MRCHVCRCVPRAYRVDGGVEYYVSGAGADADEFDEAMERYERAVEERADELLDKHRDEEMEDRDEREDQ